MTVPQNAFCVLLVFLTAVPLSWALKFDLAAHMGHEHKYERCIRNFVAKDTLVLVTAIVDGTKGDGQVVNMNVRTVLKPISYLPWEHSFIQQFY